jgi:hypothetical protein
MNNTATKWRAAVLNGVYQLVTVQPSFKKKNQWILPQAYQIKGRHNI